MLKPMRVDRTIIYFDLNMVQQALTDYAMKLCPEFKGMNNLEWIATEPWSFTLEFEPVKKEG